MWFKPKWTKLVSDMLQLNTDPRIQQLEQIRNRYGIDHEEFARMISFCPLARQRFYMQADGMLKYGEGIADSKRRWEMLAIERACQYVAAKFAGVLSQEQALDKVQEFQPQIDSFRSLSDVVDFCIEMDRRMGLICPSSPAVTEIEAVIQGVMDENSDEMFERMKIMVEFLEQQRKDMGPK